tara:strand:+ start:21 stop:1088 length:1068 start_codon:yes stop_codon:yes gene_type:complete
MGIKVLKPNIISSNKRFIVNKDNEIEYGLGAIKGVADSFIKHVCEKRNILKFKDLWDFSKKIDIKLGGKKSLEALSQSGAFDSLSPSRSIAIASVQDMLKDGSNKNSISNLKSGDLFADFDETFDPYEKYKNIQDLTLTEQLEFEKKSLGYYLSGHPVAAIKNKVNRIRSHSISELTNDIKKSSLICLINSVRQIKDRKGKPLTFINFDDGTGIMDGIVSSEVLDNCHNLLKEGSILSLKGIIEVDDYKTNDIGALMFRMRVKEVQSIDDELVKKTNEILIDLQKSDILSLENMAEKLELIDSEFWNDGACSINLKVQTDESEAIIKLGKEYNFSPTLENLFYLEDILGKNVIQL